MSRVGLIAKLEARLMLADPTPIVLLLGMPLVLAVFFANGLVGGPAHSIPGLASLFGFFGLGMLGIAFFRDHGWNTWERLRTSAVGRSEVVIGKSLPFAVLFFFQQVLLLAVGRAFFGMPWSGGLAEAGLLIAAIVAVELSLGLLLVSVCRTVNQLFAAGNLGALMIAGVGGALAPIPRLPDWLAPAAPVSPVYWALSGYSVLVEGSREPEALGVAIAVLCGVAGALGALASLFFRMDSEKTFFA